MENGRKKYEKGQDDVAPPDHGAFEWLRSKESRTKLTLQETYMRLADIVVLFITGIVTFVKDKVPVLSGIAQKFRTVLEERFKQDENLAGLWRGNLAKEFLWSMPVHYCKALESRPRPRENNIPTWGWASVNGIVQFETVDERLEPRYRIIECHVNFATDDSIGQVTGGSMVMKHRITHGCTIQTPPPIWEAWAMLELP